VKQPNGSMPPVVLAVLLAGCSNGLGANSKQIGAEGGACTSGGGCDPGLVCLSRLCVRLEDAAVRTDDVAAQTDDVAAQTDGIAAQTDDVATSTEDVATKLDDAATRTEDVATKLADAATHTEDAVLRFEDAAMRVDASVDQAGCRNWTLGGIGVPAGTVPSANASYGSTLPIHAIDGDLSTGWNSGSYSGWLRLEFPSPTYLTGVRILAGASPSSSETYTISADLLTSPIGGATRTVYADAGTTGTILDPIAVTPGTYTSLTLTISGGLSWVAVNELSILTPTCP
jgi:hypothetical protein